LTCRKVIAAPLLLLLFTVTWILTPAGSAQFRPDGRLASVVQDSSGAVMPGVEVTARNVGTGLKRAFTSDAEGRWTIRALPVGTITC
jgi:hypothetical protein